MQEAVTLRHALAAATARLAAAGVADPGGDARRLLAHAVGIAPDRVSLGLAEPMPPDATARFDAAIAARAMRRPVAQIIGERLFWGRAFRVTGDVLDPRPETETLIAAALEAPFVTIIDLGTGSGAILVTLLAERRDACGLGVDINPAALRIAGVNAVRHGVAARARWHCGDWFEGLDERVELIVTNPPYIGAQAWARLDPEVRDWEPRMALTPGPDGLAAYGRIAQGARAHLSPGGRLLAEVGAGQARAVCALWQGVGLVGVETRADLDGRDRVVVGTAP